MKINKRIFASAFIGSLVVFTLVVVSPTHFRSPKSSTGQPLGWEAGDVLTEQRAELPKNPPFPSDWSIYWRDFQKADQSVTDDGHTLKFRGSVLATKEPTPQLFIEEPAIRNDNALYTYSLISDFSTGTPFLRVDKEHLQTGTAWFDNATVLFRYNFEEQRYDPVLISSPEQNSARFPLTEIVSQNPLTVKFDYDVASPNGCYGRNCRAYWAEYYRYDGEQRKFVLANGEYKESYEKLLNEYEDRNNWGCGMGTAEEQWDLTLEEVYNHSEIDYCKQSSRDELERFMRYWQKTKDIIR